MFALSRVGAPGCFIVGLFAFYLLLGDWGLLNGGFLLMNLAIFEEGECLFHKFLVCYFDCGRCLWVSVLSGKSCLCGRTRRCF